MIEIPQKQTKIFDVASRTLVTKSQVRSHVILTYKIVLCMLLFLQIHRNNHFYSVLLGLYIYKCQVQGCVTYLQDHTTSSRYFLYCSRVP